jgi:hypothetical protein
MAIRDLITDGRALYWTCFDDLYFLGGTITQMSLSGGSLESTLSSISKYADPFLLNGKLAVDTENIYWGTHVDEEYRDDAGKYTPNAILFMSSR